MQCPNCGKTVADEKAECPHCSVIFDKWKPRTSRPAPEAPPPLWRSLLSAWRGSAGFYPSLAATATAVVYGWKFSSFLPITEGWSSFQKILFPLTSLDLAFHEAGHLIFGLLGIRFIAVAGGTIGQLFFPAACLIHFLRRDSKPGIAFCVFWTGLNFAEISWYAADASLQCLILITGMSGREGGGHDWNYMLGQLGLIKECIGIGRLFFVAGIWLMVFAPAALLAMKLKHVKSPDAD